MPGSTKIADSRFEGGRHGQDELRAGLEQHAMNSAVSTIMTPPVSCSPQTPIKHVLEVLDCRRIGSMLIVDQKNYPIGIFTLPDVLRRVVIGASDMHAPISTVMSHSPLMLPPQAPLYEAALIMQQHRVRHLPVVARGELVGMVSERDLFGLQGISLQSLSELISGADSHERLIAASRDIRELGKNMLAQGMAVDRITTVISRLNDLLSQRAIELHRDPAIAEIEFCWVALGSEGRYEQTLTSDQDNGIVFQTAVDAAAIRDRLLPSARKINSALADYGFPLCKGNVMAGNPQWCLSLNEWKTRFAGWIDRGSPQSLLNATIFFDFRALYGASALAEDLRGWLAERARRNLRFLHQMAENAMHSRPPLSRLGTFKPARTGEHAGTIDIKLNGAMLFVDAARIYSLQTGVTATNTEERLRGAADKLDFVPAEVEAWIEAFHYIRLLRLKNESGNYDGGGHHLRPARLNSMQRTVLREALIQARTLQRKLALDYQL